jgi:alpha-glucosidase (family GH31 glycosyl hydrolase)
MGMQGMGYMHSDLGGFAGANLDDELYTRWLQYGVFNPIYRPHAQEEVPSEPVLRDQKTEALAKKSILLRYQLMPYNYTLAFINHRYGTPLMRPLFFENDANKALLTNDKTYYWGSDFLISPVMKPGVKTQTVYFPKQSNWYDFYTDKKVDGGQTKVIDLHDDYIPTYVRGGAFIPMIKPIQNTTQYSLKSFELGFYFDSSVAQSSGQLYNDDGETPQAFEKGQYEILHFNSKLKNQRLKISINTTLGKNFKYTDKTVHLIVHNIVKTPRKVRGYNYQWNSLKHTLKIDIPLNSSIKKTILIKL